MANIELLNIDCMEYMAGLPDKDFDLAIVDPPYGIKAKLCMAEILQSVNMLGYEAEGQEYLKNHQINMIESIQHKNLWNFTNGF